MRLKGGKVLLDGTNVDLSVETEVVISLTDEELKAALEKGFEILLRHKTIKWIMPFVPCTYTKNLSGDLVEIISEQNGDYVTTLNIADKEIVFAEL